QAAATTTDPAIFLMTQALHEMRRDFSTVARTLNDFILSYGPLLHTAVNESRAAATEVAGIAAKLKKLETLGDSAAIKLDALAAAAPKVKAFVYDLLTKEQVDEVDTNQSVENLATSLEEVLWKDDKEEMKQNLKQRVDRKRVRFLVDACLHRRAYSTHQCRETARKSLTNRVNTYAA
ncbi:hypothetical protein PFISCL1PPCAC_1840, partial [Pristionchus fissidentatus]